jgi:polar amino acid transport system substrate-binding protein
MFKRIFVRPPCRSIGIAAGLVTCAVMAAACSSSSQPAAQPASNSPSSGAPASGQAGTVNAALRAQLPASVRQSGELTVATSADYPPFESIGLGSTAIVGFDPDLGNALGKVLGIRVNFINAGFDGLIPGLASGKYEAVMAGIQDKKSREQVVTFVDYLSSGSVLAVAQGNPQHISSFTSLCGKPVAVEEGTTQVAFADSQAAQCTGAGKAAISVQVFSTENDANLALSSGRVAAVFAETATQAYAVQQSSGQLSIVGPVYDKQHVGIAVPKGQTGLADAFMGAVRQLITNGSYHALVAKWSLTSGAIDAPVINQPYS